MNILAPVLIGFGFGFVLQKARLGRYDTIVNVFRFTDLTVIKFLLTALSVGMIGVQALLSLQLVSSVPVAQTYLLGNFGGGLVFGAGMALAGFCPGTVAAGAGEGRLDYIFAGGLGLCAGALCFGLCYSKLFVWLSNPLRLGAITLPQLLGVEPWLLIGLFCELALLLLYWIERGLPHPVQTQRHPRHG